MQTCRLIYRSLATAEVVSNETLRALESTASTKNKESEITGLLLLSGNVFLQVLEGPSKAVNELYATIVGDRRHRAVELLSFEHIDSRLFGDWNMRLVDLYDLPGEKRTHLASKYDNANGVIEIPKQLPRIYALLFDAQHICNGGVPWGGEEGDEADDQPLAV